jgi:CcmD family protein
MTGYLLAAYVATWLIHLGYAVILTRKYSRLKEEARELTRNQAA